MINAIKPTSNKSPEPWWGYLFVLVGACVLLGWTQTTHGDVVWIRGQASPVYGKIITSSDSGLQILLFENGEFGDVLSIARNRVEQTLVNYDPMRLGRLDPGELEQYRDYAEELASQTGDPSALHLARRLYLIAAANSTGELRRGSLLGLIGMAESKTQRRRLQILLFLSDPDAPLASLKSKPDDAIPLKSVGDQQLMLKLVRALRKEVPSEALAILANPENRTVLERWDEDCSLEEFDQLARVDRPSKIQLRKLLAIELQIVHSFAPQLGTRDRRPTWGDFASQTATSLGTIPTFENVTTFSPIQSVFRNGNWVEPR